MGLLWGSMLGGPGDSDGIGILTLLLASRAVSTLRLNLYREETSMAAQLNRFMALFALCGLLTRPAMAASADSLSTQTKAMDTSLDYWTGRIERDTTWRDTVYVSGDMTIASGTTLTLAPDTQVLFLPYRDDTQGGLDSTRAELTVEGRLHAQAEGIVFRSAAATSLGADWYGIVVERGGLANVSNAAIRDGLRCLYAKMGGRVTMDHVAFANCGKPTAQSFSRRSAASDSLSALGTSPQAVVGDSANTTEESLLNSVFMGQPFRFSAAVSDSTKDDMKPDKRIFNKQIHGALGGFIIALGSFSASEESASILVPIAYSLGTAIGVSKIDPHDRFIASLGGSVVGLIGGIGLTSISKVLFPSLLVGPIIGATIMSEWSRKPPQARRVSVGLIPDPKGGLSAVATLRF